MERIIRISAEVFGMIQYSYEEVIEKINNGTIKEFSFCVDNYSHYKNCIITRTEYKIYNGKSITQVDVSLTKDSSEKISFLNEFKEDTKLFNLGKKGKFTLKQLWSKIIILEIINN